MNNVFAKNKKVYYEYNIIDTFEAGICLTGGEVKSVKSGGASLKDSYVRLIGGDVVLVNAKISKWKGDTTTDYDSTRSRKLLLKKKEIKNLFLRKDRSGGTVIPLELYRKGSLIKVKIALGKGKKVSGKKKSIIERDLQRSLQREKKLLGRSVDS